MQVTVKYWENAVRVNGISPAGPPLSPHLTSNSKHSKEDRHV